MGEKTEISWTDATWNPVVGCSPVSEGCRNCYAARMAARFCQKGEYYEGAVIPMTIPAGNGLWSGRTVRKQPKFNPLTAKRPRTIFVCSMGDLFHSTVPDDWINEVMAVIALTPQQRYMILTKRPARMQEYFAVSNRVSMIADAAGWLMDDGDGAHDTVINSDWPLSNLALGVSVEDQKTVDERVPILLDTLAVKRYISYEPALGPIMLKPEWLGICPECGGTLASCRRSRIACCPDCQHGQMSWLDLVIMGGESGARARPMHPDWARSLRNQCQDAGIPIHFKGWGKWVYPTQMTEEAFRRWDYYHGTENDLPKPWSFLKTQAGRLLDGREHNGSITWED